MKRAGHAVGFTLIEMAIVIVVIGLLLSGGLVAVAPVIENSNISKTNQRLDRIEQALVLHVIRFGCLPCPANPTTTSSTAGVGQGDAAGTYSSGCKTSACTYASGSAPGVVPWVNLGLSEADVTDGFGMRIGYVIGTNLQQTNAMKRGNENSYPSGDLTVNNSSGQPIVSAAAAYVLVSYGPDMAFGYRAQTGTHLTTNIYNSPNEAENADADTIFVQDDMIPNKTSTTYFDDLVRWRSGPMIVQLCGSGACGNPN